MNMDTFFSETNVASLRHLALPGITATDRTALFGVLSKRFIAAQDVAKASEARIRATTGADTLSSIVRNSGLPGA